MFTSGGIEQAKLTSRKHYINFRVLLLVFSWIAREESTQIKSVGCQKVVTPSSESRSVGEHQLVYVSTITHVRVDVYGGYIYSYWDYKPTFTSLGGHHLVWLIGDISN